MRQLYLVRPGRERSAHAQPSWTPPRFDLDRQPQRPGELCREIRLRASEHDSAVEAQAAAAGVPSSLWATLAIESQRCLQETASLFGVPGHVVSGALEHAASDGRKSAAGPSGESPSRLYDYARALVRAGARPARPTIGGLLLRPPLRMLTAWSLSCHATGLPLEAWATLHLAEAINEPVNWEASAAQAGQTLAEWIVVQTARRLRSTSTLAHTAG